jgi:hypothetical protein
LLKPLFWILDQLDSLIGVLVIASFSWKPSVPMIIALLIVTVVVHPLGAKAMVGLGLKKSIA